MSHTSPSFPAPPDPLPSGTSGTSGEEGLSVSLSKWVKTSWPCPASVPSPNSTLAWPLPHPWRKTRSHSCCPYVFKWGKPVPTRRRYGDLGCLPHPALQKPVLV